MQEPLNPAALRRRRLITTGFACVAAAMFGRAGAQTPDAPDWPAIRTVIEAQLAAFHRGDASEAYSFAAPGIQQMFGSPDRFLQMVQQAYSILIDPARTEFLEGAVLEGLIVQPVRVFGRDDAVAVALYTMERRPDGQWRINGCRLAPSTVRAT